MSWHEEIIQHIKDCGQFLIDNAEKIVNSYEYNADLTITCYPTARDGSPSIIIEHEVVPEKIVERYR